MAAPRSLALFVLDPALLGPSGTARATFLFRSLRSRDAALGGRLLVVKGDPADVVPRLAAAVGAGRCTSPPTTAPTAACGTRPSGRAWPIPDGSSSAPRRVHRPWALPGGIPAGYPEPMVDHRAERLDALARYEQVKAAWA